VTPSPRVVFPQRFHRPTWAEVDLRRLQENLRRLRRRLPPPVGILLVVKGDAYGHGALSVSRAALASGAVDRLGVSSVEEGLALRDAGIRRPILILGSLYPFGSTLAAVRGGLTVTVASLDGARLIAARGNRLPRQFLLFDHIQQSELRLDAVIGLNRNRAYCQRLRTAHLPVRVADFGEFMRRFSGRIYQAE